MFKSVKYFSIPFFLFSLLTITGCEEDDPQFLEPLELEFRESLVELMEEWYLWNEELPAVNVYNYESAEELLQAMLNKEYDRWSYLTDEVSFDQYFKAGEFVGTGFGTRWDENNDLRISLVQPGSAADSLGIKRGFKILKINSRDVNTINNFSAAFGGSNVGEVLNLQLEDFDGETKDYALVKDVVKINSILHNSVHLVDGKRVGYMVFNNFIEKSKSDLEEVIGDFKEEQVTELIVDLRYNGGGLFDIGILFGSMLAPKENQGKLFSELTHNASKKANDEKFYLEAPSVNLDLKRVIFITTRSSASASEVLISGLKPYVDVVTIGKNTNGKLAGMYAFRMDGKVVVPISFRVVNSVGETDLFDGIPVNSLVEDDLTRDFGDENEKCLKEALNYLSTGIFTNSGSRLPRIETKNKELYKGFRREIGMY
ncbi:S41 family peptidase [Flexithrix dorotheae]|uniref:S41 family peptidase n=1 Tax=Flexithrix dorotheae TaxID=70993 RepID=UPI000363E721|nr:S41 family peptidase [Flexithrix dorotheae]